MKILAKFTFKVIIASIIFTACQLEKAIQEPATYVNPFIGTDAHGHTYPGASLPFGMVQLSPQSRLSGWDGCSGYHYTDSVIYGFAHTALNGTGVGDYGDILVMPVVSEPVFLNQDYASSFRKTEEKAQAGYYKVKLDKWNVLAEHTATTRVGYHRYTFPKSDKAGIVVDLQHRDKVTDSWIEIVSETEIRGMRRSTNWAKDMVWYFHMEFSKPFDTVLLAIDDSINQDVQKIHGTNTKAFVKFKTSDNESIEVKVSLSAVDSDGALKNMKEELPAWNFDDTRTAAFQIWNTELSKIIVSGGTEGQNIAFYTALYHSFLQPNTFMDVDNRYRGIDKKVHTASDFTNYTVFSLWDTFRTWHPMMTILDQKRSTDFIRTMLNMYQKGGLLPVWELAANETSCMIGNHAISVIADAYSKGIQGFDTELALEAMIFSAQQDHHGLKAYRTHGYIPGDKEHESISKTLEYAYNDWCIAAMAKEMGKPDIYNEFIRRAQYYKNILDSETGFMRPKLNGNWLSPFDPTTVDWHFTEANSWQYSFYVPQDITGFYTQLGGKPQLISQLDKLFSVENKVSGRDMKDITGLIGQYAHGNEPSHHMAYLYNYVNQPWKTQNLVRKIMDEFYTPTPSGSIGNEDCGQMSAWLVMSAMGFYPVTPGLPQYAIGTPWFPKMEIRLENGKTFTITANNVSATNKYIQSASLNGKPYLNSFLDHSNIKNGGTLHFVMSNVPNEKWGSLDANIPKTYISEELILPVPVIVSDERRIRKEMEISIQKIDPESDIYYTTNGSTPTIDSEKYENPFVLKNTTTVKAVAYKMSLGYSFVTEADFVKIDLNKKIEIKSEYSLSYHAGGAEALIDGIRGSENWRLGGWQGYQAQDFECVIDLGSIKPIKNINAGFVQDIRSWIWMPTEVTFFGSTDGKSYSKLLRVKNNVKADNYDIQSQNLGGKVNAKVRYIKTVATNFGTIPDWHLGAGGEAFIFIDEIEIE
ncbi:MAG: GH92 family glycosyl hydrolase [Salinivirgaceae bacterium]|nr:GH92 family glycosyl hydrolase [Salinivirgaceae bacterium]